MFPQIWLEIDKYMNKWINKLNSSWNCYPIYEPNWWFSYLITLRLNRCSEEPNDNNSRPWYKKNTVGVVEK